MVALAAVPFERFRTSTIEVDALDRRYTVETLESMQNLYPGAELLFITGTDMYREIDIWKDYRRLFELAHLIIVNRPGFPFREDLAPFHVLAEQQTVALPKRPAVFYLPFVQQPISSSVIREDRRQGREVQSWLPPQVWSYIERNRLYT
jgi:nicotinate-nucleotide adenylyltransferase